jgi:hypothetical protein
MPQAGRPARRYWKTIARGLLEGTSRYPRGNEDRADDTCTNIIDTQCACTMVEHVRRPDEHLCASWDDVIISTAPSDSERRRCHSFPQSEGEVVKR